MNPVYNKLCQGISINQIPITYKTRNLRQENVGV